jgi:hypothetical protein
MCLLLKNCSNSRVDLDGWEIVADNLIVFHHQKLGSGAFAAVFKGALTELPAFASRQRKYVIEDKSAVIDVAVKMPLATAGDELGYHLFLKNTLTTV